MNYDQATLKSIIQSFLERVELHSDYIKVTLRGVDKCSYPTIVVYLRGFEPPAFWSVAKRSIQLS